MPQSDVPLTVQIVEDDKRSRQALTLLLKKTGFVATATANLAAARQALDRATPHILVLDLMLPDGEGTTLLAEIRRKNLPVKVAVVTGVTDQLKLHEVTALKPDALFGKPIDVKDFEDWFREQRMELYQQQQTIK